VEKAVKGMLPKGVLGRQMFTKLKCYATPDHPHVAQQPKPLPLSRQTARTRASASASTSTSQPKTAK
jgi:ribosomal protein L13